MIDATIAVGYLFSPLTIVTENPNGRGWLDAWTISAACHANARGLACLAPRYWPARAWHLCACGAQQRLRL